MINAFLHRCYLVGGGGMGFKRAISNVSLIMTFDIMCKGIKFNATPWE